MTERQAVQPAVRPATGVATRYVSVEKIAYALLFVLVIPALLVWWAVASAHAVRLPLLPYPAAGAAVAIAGVALMLSGMAALIRYGRGLPMNAYPPPIYVTQGIYTYTSQPIYTGFVMCCAGTSIALESPSGLWLVSPMVALGLAALVLGYERHDLRRRFGASAEYKPAISLPPDDEAPLTLRQRASVYLLVALPWALTFESVCRLGIPPDGVDVRLPFERGWPVLEWTEVIYGSVYIFVLATPLVVRTQAALRAAAVLGLIATAFVTFLYLTVPAISPPRPFEPQTWAGRALMLERAACHTVAAFPSFHVVWSLIAARAWATRSRNWGAAGWTWAALIALTCLTTGMHAIADVLAAAVVFLLLTRHQHLWDLTRRGAEKVANSWFEWRWKDVRVLSYFFYAMAAASVGFWIAAAVGGPEAVWPLIVIHICGILGAASWAQRLEGSPTLSRPFGYYGSVLGVLIGTLGTGPATGPTMRLLAVMAIAAPWVQAIGRLRCLAQGCCHGSPAPDGVGIHYRVPRSRVCAYTTLGGVALHPTPLYSIFANIAIGLLLARLWSLGATYGLIAGIYLLLAGFTRFVEESYRGEPQTPILGGVRLYQWMAIGSAVGGAILTSVPGADPGGTRVFIDAKVVTYGLVFGAVTGLAMGVDFPASRRRFARLAPP